MSQGVQHEQTTQRDHCAAGIRAGAFWMIRRVLRDGWTAEAAEKEAERIGLRESPHLNEFARRYFERPARRASENRDLDTRRIEYRLQSDFSHNTKKKARLKSVL